MTQSQSTVTILVIEDDLATCEFLVELLDMEGYATRHAASGHAGLGALQQYPVHAVLLDRRLPDMDGLHVCREIRRLIHRTLPVMLLTADFDMHLEAAARAAGATEYLGKPFPPQKLLDRIAALVQA